MSDQTQQVTITADITIHGEEKQVACASVVTEGMGGILTEVLGAALEIILLNRKNPLLSIDFMAALCDVSDELWAITDGDAPDWGLYRQKLCHIAGIALVAIRAYDKEKDRPFFGGDDVRH
ncbi:hypothetical protein [Insolitispirillum peregrinum]|uniref:Uncharacterized protein n=1 Tax=Insolitispirillum peregrinum TaxID=80876 RepID=A0A1N7LSJ7_9PROT|nr:hypothetical protein [Insolitispirillum peregrinum]SIS76817.1 hypothetical protein SAMN05421779_103531 [Insolitispirillum peregrinum]